MTTSLTKQEPGKVRRQLLADLEWLRLAGKQAEKVWMRAAHAVYLIQRNQWWRKWRNQETNKIFQDFDEWIRSDCGMARGKVYNLLDVKKNLKLPARTLEMIGQSRCYELARLARHKPRQLPKMVERIRKNPELTHREVHRMVSTAIEGRADTVNYTQFEIAANSHDATEIRRALLVMQQISPVNRPDTEAGMGTHFANICREFLSTEEAQRVQKELDEVGALETTRFETTG